MGGPELPPAARYPRKPPPPRWLANLPYGLVLCGVCLGLAVVAMNHFQPGSLIIGASVFAATLARLFLHSNRLGLLAVRRRWVDVLLMSAAAIAIIVLAVVAGGPSG